MSSLIHDNDMNFLTSLLHLCPLPKQSNAQTESLQIHAGHHQLLHWSTPKHFSYCEMSTLLLYHYLV